MVQTATERALHAIATLDADRPFRPWFLRIVANTARNHRRSRWRRHAAELRLAARPADAEDPAVAVVEAGRRRALVAALNRLSVEDRLVIALRHFEQLTEREMADALDCAPGTVKSRLFACDAPTARGAGTRRGRAVSPVAAPWWDDDTALADALAAIGRDLASTRRQSMLAAAPCGTGSPRRR